MDTENTVYGSFIANEMKQEGRESVLQSPTDGTQIAKVYFATPEMARAAIDSAYESQEKWSSTPLRRRRELLGRLADIVQERSEEYAMLETMNTGKTIRQSTFMDVPLAVEHIRYFSSEREFKSRRRIRHPEFPGTVGEIQYAPMGVVGAIVPWNVPLLMTVWKIAPALLAGNTLVVKPSSYTPLTALELAKDSVRAGFPSGVLNVIPGEGRELGSTLTSSNRVNMISFTGSTDTGKEIMRNSASSIKKVTLELGGKSPNIVFDDCDMDHAVSGVLFGIFLNSGQLCESGSRLLIQSSIREKFVSRLKERLSAMKPGNPADFETEISAITNREQKNRIERMVAGGVRSGAIVEYAKNMEGSPSGGLYYPPTLLSSVTPDMEVGREEIFGPVLSIMEFTTEEEAIQIANSSRYGLAAGIWSMDRARCMRVASRLQAGTVWINEYHLLSAAAPRGGFKDSGIGRELGLEGILEYTQTRHLFINKGETDLDEAAYGLIFSGDK